MNIRYGFTISQHNRYTLRHFKTCALPYTISTQLLPTLQIAKCEKIIAEDHFNNTINKRN
jgi:hypothetical protein